MPALYSVRIGRNGRYALPDRVVQLHRLFEFAAFLFKGAVFSKGTEEIVQFFDLANLHRWPILPASEQRRLCIFR